jgi:polyisoprenoid-binding protein YceI
MKRILLILLFLEISWIIQAQVYKSQDAMLSFFSSAPIEDIRAESNKGVSAVNFETKSIYFKVAIRSFEFPKRLMQEHFNENYLESHKYPFAEFKGNITGTINSAKDGLYQVKVQGDITIHGVTRNYTVDGNFKVDRGRITGKSTFPVKLVDHHIKIPSIVIKNIAEIVDVTVVVNYEANAH